jgi:polyribonucleotide nucleotidyltransferase
VTTSDSSAYVPQPGERFVGTVRKTAVFGAFVTLPPGGEGLLHISHIRQLYGGRKVKDISELINVGDQIEVVVQDVDNRGKISLIPVQFAGQ